MANSKPTHCADCGQEIEQPKGRGRPRKRCLGCASPQSQGWGHGVTRPCDECGSEYRARHPASRYCSRSCQCKASKDRKASQPHTHTCQGCGAAYTPRRSEATTYCSRECAFRDYRSWHGNIRHVCWLPEYSQVWPCAQCGKMHGRKHSKFCGSGCRFQYGRTPLERRCRECYRCFTPQYGDKRRAYCSTVCAKRSARRTRRSAERARLREAKVEPVNPFLVFERDGWCCQICGKHTPRARRGTRYSNAPELDHRVPLSLGGEHSYANTQCACKACNADKGNGSSVGQYPLISAA